MSHQIGILFAFGALFGWGLGDFSIQRAVRAVGSVRALFYIGALGAIGLLPFVWGDITPVLGNPGNLPALALLVALILGTAFANFEALKRGKLSVILPIDGIELVVAVLLAVFVGHEHYGLVIYATILLVFVGIVLISVVSLDKLFRLKWEKGVAFALVAAVGLGTSNFAIGLSSRAFSPLFTIWLTHTSAALFAGAIMFIRDGAPFLRRDLKKHFNVIAAQSLLDNLGWLSYAYATLAIPIGIATTISEGYLPLGTLLGFYVNKERLKTHQYAGVALVILGIFALCWITG